MRPEAVLSGVLVILLSSVSQGNACSCQKRDYSQAEINEEFARSEAVFVGRVISIQDVRTPTLDPDQSEPARLVVFEVSRYWRGPARRRTTVFTGDGRSDCGFVFQKGADYLVFAESRVTPYMPGALNTSMCSYTDNLANEERVMRVLGTAKPAPSLPPGYGALPSTSGVGAGGPGAGEQ